LSVETSSDEARLIVRDSGWRIPALALTIAGRTDARLGQLIAQVQRDVPKPLDPATLTAEIARLSGRERRRAQR
jgi:hypothetical protein